MTNELLALAERVEALMGPCRGTDRAIFAAIGTHVLEKRERDKKAWWYPVDKGAWSPRIDNYFGYPTFTASLDAAMSLVPTERFISVDRTHTGRGAAVVWGDGADKSRLSKAATPALALTAAALRARAALVS